MRSPARVAALAALTVLAPALASAQQVRGPAAAAAAAAAGNAASTNAGAPAAAPAQATTPDSDAEEGGGAAPPGQAPKRPVVPATGYGWTPEKPGRVAPGAAHPRLRAHASSRVEAPAVLPGFEMLADGSSRLFLQLSRAAKFDAKTARGVLTYVIHGSRSRRNDYNPLVTVHFNTPVSSARLVPHGRDLWFVVDLRANVTPTVAMDTTKDGGAMLRIEFPKADYLKGTPEAPASAPAPRRAVPPGANPPPATPGPAAPASSAAPDNDSDGL